MGDEFVLYVRGRKHFGRYSATYAFKFKRT